MRITLQNALNWRGREVIVNKRHAYILSVPAEYAGFSASFLSWIQYVDADTSLDVVDIYLVDRSEITFIED